MRTVTFGMNISLDGYCDTLVTHQRQSFPTYMDGVYKQRLIYTSSGPSTRKDGSLKSATPGYLHL